MPLIATAVAVRLFLALLAAACIDRARRYFGHDSDPDC